MMKNKLINIIKLLNGYGLESYISGGTARDVYLGRKPNGIDVSVKATLSDLRKCLESHIMQVNDHNTSIDLVYENQTYTLYPLKKVTLVNTYYHYKFTNLFQEDAESKDFTINSLYYDPIKEEWLDYFNGREDCDKKIIRFTVDPESRILESKIRLLRAPVLCGILGHGWKLHPTTTEAIEKHRLKIVVAHSKQIQKEMLNLFTRSYKPSKVFNLLRNTKLLDQILPELLYCVGVEQSNKRKDLDLYQHIMYALDSVSIKKDNSLIIRLGALLHDIGKPNTEVYTNTGVHFYNHENVGALLTEKILFRWGFTKNIIDKVSLLVAHHLFDASPKLSKAAVKRLIARVGPEHINDLLDLRIADRKGTGRKNISMSKVELLRKRVRQEMLNLNPENFKLQLTDKEITNVIQKKTDNLPEALNSVKKYLESKVLYGKLFNKRANLRKHLYKVNSINCPLDTKHLFTTWKSWQSNSADVFPNGNLKCGVYCNFTCNKYLKSPKKK